MFIVDCINGTYGTECMYNCSNNCVDDKTCDKISGHCKDCLPGWMGSFCNTSKHVRFWNLANLRCNDAHNLSAWNLLRCLLWAFKYI